MFGLLLLSWTNIFLENDLLAGIFFAIVLNFKHLFLSLAPIYFIYLLRHYCFMKGRFHLFNFLALGSSVLFIFALSLGYFVYLGQLPQLLSRLFPFARGLCHAYWAPNFWVFYNMLDKLLVQSKFPISSFLSNQMFKNKSSDEILTFSNTHTSSCKFYWRISHRFISYHTAFDSTNSLYFAYFNFFNCKSFFFFSRILTIFKSSLCSSNYGNNLLLWFF